MSLWIAALSVVVPFGFVTDIAPKPSNGRDPLAVAIARFGNDLAKPMLSEPKNSVFSPYSIMQAFAMAREGAEGETAAELDRVLHVEALASPHALAGTFARFDSAMVPGSNKGTKKPKAGEFRLATTNGAWVQEGLTLEGAFRTQLESRFKAIARTIDFRDTESARKDINEWVGEATAGRIDELLGDGLPTPDTVLMLVNAIHLEARWLHQFREGQTSAEPFTREPGRTIDVQMMHLLEELDYGETEHAQRVILPYLGADMEMVVIVPKKGLTLADLTEAEQNAAEGQRKPTAVNLALPKFDFGCTFDLIPTLKALGMQRAFDLQKAEFGRISKQGPLAIGAVVHGASIRVDEHGTEAAAATAIAMLKGADLSGPATVEVRADRPFLFHLRHTRTGAILFRGRVEEPTHAP